MGILYMILLWITTIILSYAVYSIEYKIWIYYAVRIKKRELYWLKDKGINAPPWHIIVSVFIGTIMTMPLTLLFESVSIDVKVINIVIFGMIAWIIMPCIIIRMRSVANRDYI